MTCIKCVFEQAAGRDAGDGDFMQPALVGSMRVNSQPALHTNRVVQDIDLRANLFIQIRNFDITPGLLYSQKYK